jgi:UDP-N-acetylglucosamine--N-acetylmuramyl-(pentapeptide) pyrophosphoryl-undecaprenol N-acetylglucosamine transferase
MELARHAHKDRYHAIAMLAGADLRKAASVADLIVSRAGSGAIFEIAAWEKPAILVPIPDSVSRDQRTNAYTYARAGGAEVIEQENFTPHVLLSEAQRILSDVTVMEHMRAGARAFKKPDAARLIAQELMKMALKHEM